MSAAKRGFWCRRGWILFVAIFVLSTQPSPAAERVGITPKSERVLASAFNADGSLFAAAVGREVLIWKIKNGTAPGDDLRPALRLSGHPDLVTTIAFDPRTRGSSSRLVAGTQGAAWLWNASEQKRIAVLSHGVEGRATSLCFSADGGRFAIGSGIPSESGQVAIWKRMDEESGPGQHFPSGAPQHVIHDHGDVVYALGFQPDGERLAAGDAANDLKLWEVETGKLIKPVRGHSPHSGYVLTLAWAPDGKTLTSAGTDKALKVWRPDVTGAKIRDIEVGELLWNIKLHKGPVLALAYDQKSGFVVSGGSDRNIHIHLADKGQHKRSINKAHHGSIQAIAIHPDGEWFVTGSWDGRCKVWSLKDGKLLAKLAVGTTAVASF